MGSGVEKRGNGASKGLDRIQGVGGLQDLEMQICLNGGWIVMIWKKRMRSGGGYLSLRFQRWGNSRERLNLGRCLEKSRYYETKVVYGWSSAQR